MAKKTYSGKGWKKKTKPVTTKKQIKDEIFASQETKQIAYPYTQGGFSSFTYGSGSAILGCFGGINQGVTESTRIGSRIYARSIGIYLAMQPGDNNNNVRLLVVQAKKDAGGTPILPVNAGSFIQSILSNAPSSSIQYLQPVDTDRWQVLMDKCFNLRYLPLAGDSPNLTPQVKIIKKFIKINRPMQWDLTNTMNDDVYIIALGDSAASPNPGAVAGFFKSYWKDG